jgi:hypothetical protein
VDAIGGGGWGPVATATLMNGRQTEPRFIVGSVNLAEFFVTLAITLTFGLTLGFQNFLWHITIPLIIGGVLVAPVAALVSRRISPKLLMAAVGVLLVLLNGKTALGLAGIPGIPPGQGPPARGTASTLGLTASTTADSAWRCPAWYSSSMAWTTICSSAVVRGLTISTML